MKSIGIFESDCVGSSADGQSRTRHPHSRLGISDGDILHAYRNAMTTDFQDDGFIMSTGAQHDGSLLEVGFRHDPDTNTYLILHAMPARPSSLRPA